MTEHGISVKIFANLRDIVNWKQKFFTIAPKMTIADFLVLLRDTIDNGKQLYNKIVDIENNKLLPYVKIMVDGKILMPNEALSTEILSSVQEILIFPPVGGG